jgi:hypothetical protein
MNYLSPARQASSAAISLSCCQREGPCTCSFVRVKGTPRGLRRRWGDGEVVGIVSDVSPLLASRMRPGGWGQIDHLFHWRPSTTRAADAEASVSPTSGGTVTWSTLPGQSKPAVHMVSSIAAAGLCQDLARGMFRGREPLDASYFAQEARLEGVVRSEILTRCTGRIVVGLGDRWDGQGHPDPTTSSSCPEDPGSPTFGCRCSASRGREINIVGRLRGPGDGPRPLQGVLEAGPFLTDPNPPSPGRDATSSPRGGARVVGAAPGRGDRATDPLVRLGAPPAALGVIVIAPGDSGIPAGAHLRQHPTR